MGRARLVDKLPEEARRFLYKLIEEHGSSFEVAERYNEEASRRGWLRISQPTIYRIIKRRRLESGRPSWDEYFMEMARLVARRSTCLRNKVGAVLVKDNRILATGYNGAPKGLPHCSETGCLREKLRIPSGERHELCRGLHAEQNCIIQAAVFGVSTRGATLYCTHFPCSICAKMIINAEIAEIVYEHDYDDKMSRKLLEQAKIKVRRFKPTNPYKPG